MTRYSFRSVNRPELLFIIHQPKIYKYLKIFAQVKCSMPMPVGLSLCNITLLIFFPAHCARSFVHVSQKVKTLTAQ